MQLLHSILSFVVAIGVLVTVHEFGHFWVARRLGVKVLRFSVGFGRPLLSRRAGPDGTEYVLAAIPLGGYVKMLDEGEGEVAEDERHRAFNRQPLWVRAAVVVAGPAFNFAFAVLAYAVMFMLGVSGLRAVVGDVQVDSIAARAGLSPGQQIVAVDGRDTATWDGAIQALIGAALGPGPVRLDVRTPEGSMRELRLDLGAAGIDDLTRGQFFTTLGVEPARPSIPARIGEVGAGGAAAAAGLAPGDLVVEAGGQAIADWSHWVRFVRARPGRSFVVEVERDGALRELELTPAPVEEAGATVGRIGASVADAGAALDRFYVTERHAPWTALAEGAVKTAEVTVLTLRMLWRMLLGDVSLENLSGPISIGQYAGIAAERGAADFLHFLAVISVSLGILNLLPVPLLDGGHLLYYAAELVRGRPLSEEAQFVGQRLGIALLVGLMGIAFYNDLSRVFG